LNEVGDDWWPEAWGPKCDPDRPVLRVEFEIGRDGLREFGTNTPEEVFENAPALWAYSTGQWLTLRTHGLDDTLEALHPYIEAYGRQRQFSFDERVAEKRRNE
jgi:hypothetical protein